MDKKNLKALLEKRSALIAELDGMVNGLENDKGEVRAFTEDEMKAYGEKKTEVEALTASIKAIQETRARISLFPPRIPLSQTTRSREPLTNTVCLRNICAARLLRSEQAQTGLRLTTARLFRLPLSTR